MRRTGGSWKEPASDRYQDEAELQRVLVDAPTLLPGVGPAVAVAEFPLDGGSVDVVVVEPSGDLTLVECKLGRNTEVRRAVVGQVLSYAARVALLDVDAFTERFGRRAGVDDGLEVRLERLCQEAGIEWDAEAFRRQLALRLEHGPMRLVIAVDTVNEELRGIIEFLNRRTTGSLEVLALELELARDGDVEVLLPRVFGEESARAAASVAGAAGAAGRRRWTAEETFERLAEELDPAVLAEVHRLTDVIVARGGRLYRGQGSAPSFYAYGELAGTFRSLFVITMEEGRLGGPTIYLNAKSWSRSMPAADVDRLIDDLSEVPGLEWFRTAVDERGIGALHRVLIGDVMRSPRFVETLLGGLGPHLPPPR